MEAQDSQGMICNLQPDARRVFVTFGGLGGGIGVFAMELGRQEPSLSRSTVFMTDGEGAWYHRGVAGAGADIDAVVERLRELTAGATDVVMLGNRTGGYAALLFGALLGCEAHVFNPETTLDPEAMKEHTDERRAERLAALDGDVDARYVDLAPVISASTARLHVYHAAHGFDAAQAKRLAGLPQVTLHALDYTGGDLVKALRAQGWLQSFVDALANGSPPPAPPEEITAPRAPEPFTRALEPPGMVYNLEADAPRVFITFAGLRGGAGAAPQFEFVKSLSGKPIRTIYVRQNVIDWYHRGVAGVGPDVDSVVARLRELTADAEQVVAMGNCGGGYGALMFGALLDVDVHSFCPQTFIDPEMRAAHDDWRWGEHVAALGSELDTRYADLRPAMAASKGTFHIYYPAREPLDALHAERVQDLSQVTLHPFDYPGSDLVRALRACGWLGSFVDALVNGTEIPGAPAEIPGADTAWPALRPEEYRARRAQSMTEAP